MAITVKSAPANSDYKSAHEELWHVVDSDTKTAQGFKYWFQLQKDGEILTTITNTPYPTGSFGVLDVSNIVRSTLSLPNLDSLDFEKSHTTLSSSDATLFGADVFFTDYQVFYSEICGTTKSATDISGTYRAYNTYNRTGIHNANLNLSGDIFLTNRPKTTNYYDGEPILLNFKGKISTNLQPKIKIYDNTTSSVAFTTDLNGYYLLCINNLSKKNILIELAEASFDVPFDTLFLNKKCSKYTPYTLFFINAYGCWDSFTFVNGEIMIDNEKRRFETQPYKLTSSVVSGVTYASMQNKVGDVYNEDNIIFASQFKTKMKLTSDILNTDEYKWLFELIVSPSVYLYYKNDGKAYPVQITDTNYQMKNSLRNKAEVLEVNIDVFKQNTQYR